MDAPTRSTVSWKKGRTILLVNLPFDKTRHEIEHMIRNTISMTRRGEPLRFHWVSDLRYRSPKHKGRLRVVASDRQTANLIIKYLDGCKYGGRWLQASPCDRSAVSRVPCLLSKVSC
jgi:hypothetical protein